MLELIEKFVAAWRGRFGPRMLRTVTAVLVIAAAATVTATAAPQFTSEVSVSPAEGAACVEAGGRLMPWFEVEVERKEQLGVRRSDDLNLLLAWLRAAQLQCASGEVDRALQNIKAVARLVARRVPRRAPERDD